MRGRELLPLFPLDNTSISTTFMGQQIARFRIRKQAVVFLEIPKGLSLGGILVEAHTQKLCLVLRELPVTMAVNKKERTKWQS